jgi:hypothetical protein
MKIIDCRHDLVHRNGKDKEGNVIEITEEKIMVAKKEINTFIDNIDTQIKNAVDNNKTTQGVIEPENI